MEYKFDMVLNHESAMEIAKENMREVMFNIVISNTAYYRKLTEEEICRLRKAFNRVIKTSTTVKVCGYDVATGDYANEKTFAFGGFSKYNERWFEVANELVMTLVKTRCWYEDIIGDGFCWGSHHNDMHYEIKFTK